MNVILTNNKGGSGKTTTAILLAYAFTEIGKAVRLVDLDPQRTASQFTQQFPKVLTEGKADIVITDTPPRIDAPGLAGAFASASLAIVVTFPSPPDLWTTSKAIIAIQQAFPNLKTRLLFTGVEKGTTLGEMLDDMAKTVAVPRLVNVLHKRTAYRMAAIQGPSALTTEAKTELFKLAAEIATI